MSKAIIALIAGLDQCSKALESEKRRILEKFKKKEHSINYRNLGLCVLNLFLHRLEHL